MATTIYDPRNDLPQRSAEARKRVLNYVVVVLLLVIFGAVRLPVETRLTHEQQAGSFGNVKLNLGLREKLGQLGFLAA